jgi:hypothetical protein
MTQLQAKFFRRKIFDGMRNVFKFYLQSVEMKAFNKEVVLPHNRIIPTSVKVEVWSRDKGQRVLCGSKENLHYY